MKEPPVHIYEEKDEKFTLNITHEGLFINATGPAEKGRALFQFCQMFLTAERNAPGPIIPYVPGQTFPGIMR